MEAPLITLDHLLRICPNAMERLPKFVQPLNEGMREFEIDRPGRMAMFLANLAHESGEFQYVKELWGPTAQQKRYEPPSDLAKDLGNTEEGDGFLFRGRGLIQITGRANYEECSQALFGSSVLLMNPKLLEDPVNAARSACWFWASKDLNTLADAGDFRAVVKKINGGYNGFTFRQMYYERALNALHA